MQDVSSEEIEVAGEVGEGGRERLKNAAQLLEDDQDNMLSRQRDRQVDDRYIDR